MRKLTRKDFEKKLNYTPSGPAVFRCDYGVEVLRTGKPVYFCNGKRIKVKQ